MHVRDLWALCSMSPPPPFSVSAPAPVTSQTSQNNRLHQEMLTFKDMMDVYDVFISSGSGAEMTATMTNQYFTGELVVNLVYHERDKKSV